jgi:hypothetical protein
MDKQLQNKDKKENFGAQKVPDCRIADTVSMSRFQMHWNECLVQLFRQAAKQASQQATDNST